MPANETTQGTPILSVPSAAEVESHWKIRVCLVHWRRQHTTLKAHAEEPSGPAALGLEGVDGKCRRIQPARMADVVRAAAQRAALPSVDKIEHQRRVDRDRRVQAARRLPGPVTHAGHEFALRPRRMQRHFAAVARDDVSRVGHAGHLHLQPLDRRIDVPRRVAARRLLAQHVPRLDRLAQLDSRRSAR